MADNGPSLDIDILLDHALALIGRDGWRAFTLQALAADLGHPVARILTLVPSREAVLTEALHRVDRRMLADIAPEDEDEPIRDRLFDLILRRLDAWAPHKAALAALRRTAGATPLAMGPVACAWARSLRLTLEAAGVSIRGPAGLLRIKGLGLIEARVGAVWLGDDSADMAVTLKCLDETLGRAEEAEAMLQRLLPNGP